MLKAYLRSCVRYIVLWLVLPNLLWHACWWWFKSKNFTKSATTFCKNPDTLGCTALSCDRKNERGKGPRKGTKGKGQGTSKHAHDAVLLQEAVFQTSRTDFLASCANASVDELRFRKDRILMFQKFVRRIQGAENIKQRLSLQLLAVENWLTLKSQERNPPRLYEAVRGGFDLESDHALFREYVKFKEEYRNPNHFERRR
jgi:hypothetical protein